MISPTTARAMVAPLRPRTVGLEYFTFGTSVLSHETMKKKVDCPFCEGDGCCFCDHEGRIFVGPNEMIKSEEGLNSIGVKYIKSEDPGETWPEMWAHFLDKKNVPAKFKEQLKSVI